MSLKLMSLVMEADLGTVEYLIPATDKRPEVRGYLGTFDKHLLMVLADRGNPDGRSIYPSVEWMAKAMGATERAVRISLLRLKGTFPQILVVERNQVSRYDPLHYMISVAALERVEQWKCRWQERSGVNDVQPSGVLRGERSSSRTERHSLRAELSSAKPTSTSTSKSKAQQSQSQHPAPRNGAAVQAQAVLDGLLPEVAVALEAPLAEVPTGSAARPAGGTHAAAAPGATDPAATVAPAPRSPAAAPSARRGHPAIASYYDRWRAHHGKAPTITPKRVGILTRIYKGLGLTADVEYSKLLDALFNSADRFIVDNAHSPEAFQTKLDVLRVNGHGSPLSGLGRHGEATMRAGLEWIRQTSGVGAGS